MFSYQTGSVQDLWNGENVHRMCAEHTSIPSLPMNILSGGPNFHFALQPKTSLLQPSLSLACVIEDPPLSLMSPVWEHFGFLVKYTNGQRQVDKTKAVCRHWSVVSAYTSNLLTFTHLKWYHMNVNITANLQGKKTSIVQTQFPSAFKWTLEKIFLISFFYLTRSTSWD